jgi:hypothetical protein
MAIVTQPLGSVEARGSVGGLTYATWRGKHTVRTRAGPSREPTADQLAVLALAEEAKNAWQDLTDTERSAWNHWAAEHREPHWTGNDKRLSGFNWFVRIYVRQGFYFETTPSAPPDHDLLYTITDVAATVLGTDVSLTWTPTPFGPPDFDLCIAFKHKAASPGRAPDIHYAQFWRSTGINDGLLTDTDLDAGTYDYWLRFLQADALAGVWQHVRAQVT